MLFWYCRLLRLDNAVLVLLPTDMCAYTLNEPSFKVLCAVLFLQPFDSIVTCYCSSAVLPSVNTELHIFYEILVSQISC
jgi:hypothetical protein